MLIFPDIEKELVAYFNQALENIGTDLATDVRVGTIHSQPDQETPNKQIVIIGSYNSETLDRVTKFATVTLEVYADDYATASSLGLLAEALVRECTGASIKKAEVRLGPVRTNEEGQQERRSLDVELIVKGTDL